MLTVIEGFEMVGKTTYIKNSIENGNSFWYKPSNEIIDIMDQSKRYQINLIVSDIYSHLDKEIYLDRGLISTYVYNKFYHNCKDFDDENYIKKVVDLFKLSVDDEYMYYIIYHEDEEIAKKYYDRALLDRKNNLDEYDKFDSFKSYIEKHNEFIKYAEEFIRKYGLTNSMFISTSSLFDENKLQQGVK